MRPPSPLRDYLTSLELVRAMPDATLLPAHGPVTASVHERIDELLAHHDVRLTLTAEAVDRGVDTGLQVARALPWTRHRRSIDDLDLFNRILAVNETVAHLRVLVERGVADRDTARRRRPALRPGLSIRPAPTTAARPVAIVVGLLLGRRLDHHAHELLGAGRPQQDPAASPSRASAAVTAAATAEDAATAARSPTRHVDQRLRQPLHDAGQVGERRAGRRPSGP